MVKKKKYAYCRTCNKVVSKPKKMKLDSFHYQILIIATLSTFGLALIAFLVYRLFFQRRKYCPTCRKEVKYYDTPDDLPTPKVPVINLLERLETDKKAEDLESNEESEIDYYQCDNCERMINGNLSICPYCGWEH
ncbi:MAG: hypothetical protein GF317_13250 [Candidatus Lokiarchaeota archaeon]|nr:hypothetical protein [Candidatus Lokiarchaeota archaeon]MBD3200603.1 hypothetical protein [Candidatus Lokiarchaeota archaeon]